MLFHAINSAFERHYSAVWQGQGQRVRGGGEQGTLSGCHKASLPSKTPCDECVPVIFSLITFKASEDLLVMRIRFP
jgi:hypothetical protein